MVFSGMFLPLFCGPDVRQERFISESLNSVLQRTFPEVTYQLVAKKAMKRYSKHRGNPDKPALNASDTAGRDR